MESYTMTTRAHRDDAVAIDSWRSAISMRMCDCDALAAVLPRRSTATRGCAIGPDYYPVEDGALALVDIGKLGPDDDRGELEVLGVAVDIAAYHGRAAWWGTLVHVRPPSASGCSARADGDRATRDSPAPALPVARRMVSTHALATELVSTGETVIAQGPRGHLGHTSDVIPTA